jgi:hypothetical protein
MPLAASCSLFLVIPVAPHAASDERLPSRPDAVTVETRSTALAAFPVELAIRLFIG